MSDMASIGHALWLHEDLDAAEARHEVKAHLRSRRVYPWRIERAGGRAGAGQRPTPLEDQVGAKSSAAVCDFFSVTAELAYAQDYCVRDPPLGDQPGGEAAHAAVETERVLWNTPTL